jgi:hypothetical protein
MQRAQPEEGIAETGFGLSMQKLRATLSAWLRITRRHFAATILASSDEDAR